MIIIQYCLYFYILFFFCVCSFHYYYRPLAPLVAIYNTKWMNGIFFRVDFRIYDILYRCIVFQPRASHASFDFGVIWLFSTHRFGGCYRLVLLMFFSFYIEGLLQFLGNYSGGSWNFCFRWQKRKLMNVLPSPISALSCNSKSFPLATKTNICYTYTCIVLYALCTMYSMNVFHFHVQHFIYWHGTCHWYGVNYDYLWKNTVINGGNNMSNVFSIQIGSNMSYVIVINCYIRYIGMGNSDKQTDTIHKRDEERDYVFSICPFTFLAK